MPIVMKSSNNGMVDPLTKTVRLPDYLGKIRPKKDLLRMAVAAALPWAIWSLTPTSTQAQSFTLTSTDGYTVAVVNAGAPSGMSSLMINGTQQLGQSTPSGQWYYYREGSSGAFSPLNDLSTPTLLPNGAATGGPSYLQTVQYSGTYGSGPTAASLTATLTYILGGGGSTGAVLTESMKVQNNSTTNSVPFDLIEYNHFTLDNDSTNEQVNLMPPTSSYEADQTDTAGASITENATVTYTPDFHEAALYSATPDFLGAGFTDLNQSTSAGVGDVTWSFEWDGYNSSGLLGPGEDMEISKNISINVPEPATASVALGAASLFAIRRPRRSANIV